MKTNDKTEVKWRVKRLMDRNKITATAIAESLGYSLPWVSRVLNRHEHSEVVEIATAEALKMKREELFTDLAA